MIQQLERPKRDSSDCDVKDEEEFVLATYKHVKDLMNREKNEIVSIIGLAFGALVAKELFCHNTAMVTPKLIILSHHMTRVVLVITSTRSLKRCWVHLR